DGQHALLARLVHVLHLGAEPAQAGRVALAREVAQVGRDRHRDRGRLAEQRLGGERRGGDDGEEQQQESGHQRSSTPRSGEWGSRPRSSETTPAVTVGAKVTPYSST